MTIPIYVKEISDDCNRGALAAILPIAQYVGVIIMYVLGTYLDYYHVVYCVIGVPILMTVLLLRAPESPNFLVKQGRIDDALECVALLRGLEKTDSRVKNEVENMEKTDAINKKLPEISTFKLVKNQKWRKWVFFIGILFTLRGWNGTLCIQTYAVSVLYSTGVTFKISPEILTFGFPVVMIATALLLTVFVERFERKRLLCLAHLITAICMVAIAVVTLLQSHGTDIPSWLPITAIVVISAAFSGGVSPLPYVLVTEMFPFAIRAKVIGIISVYGWFSIFIITFLHPILVTHIGSPNTYIIYGALNLLAAIFVIIFLPKTRGKSEAEIQKVMGTE
ncbi:facilitated trehalose transporter Tret1-2 homolog [Aricia agestis]|uniref:facilitated trehalose transporter Tret1-2 homolog n=1 Tax=Aricia agestis TaxID=91739 RepID=UPI001C20B0A7|nr:facilitated trehalose transporter Tret1-2 homolog [Aricia agestis]